MRDEIARLMAEQNGRDWDRMTNGCYYGGSVYEQGRNRYREEADEILTLIRERVVKEKLTSEDMNGLHRETRDAQLTKVLEVLQ